MFRHLKSLIFTLWADNSTTVPAPLLLAAVCTTHCPTCVYHVGGKMYKTIFEGENVTHSSRKLEFLLGIEHQNIVFQAEIQFFFQQSKTYFWPWMGSYEPKRPLKYIIQSWFRIGNKKHLLFLNNMNSTNKVCWFQVWIK